MVPPETAELREAALAAAARGWHVFPITPGAKRPPAVTRWEARATTCPQRIRRCWDHGPYNIGIATGPSNLVVIDLDTAGDVPPPPEWNQPGVHDGTDALAALAEHHGQRVPFDTHMVATPRGGLHMYYTAPDGLELGNTTGTLGWHIDTRAHGGYILAPGSTVDTRCYTTLDTTAPAPLPGWLANLLHQRHAPPGPRGTTRPTGPVAGYLWAAIDAETTRVQQVPEGQRNHALYIAACALGQLAAGQTLPTDVVESALLEAAADHIHTGAYTHRQAHATITSGLRAGAKRPRQVAA